MRGPEKDATLRDTGEDALVAALTGSLGDAGGDVLVGPGDDCAVVAPPDAENDEVLLLKTDCVVEDVHFEESAPLAAVGWKAMARTLSDFAAMGGTPRHALVTLVLPGERTLGETEEVFGGMRHCAEKFGVSIIGGETSSGPVMMISVAASGSGRRGSIVLRSGGKPGDVLCVTGELGGSSGGKHLDFTPRLKEGQWLAKNARPNAMMDLSDGLGSDLPRLAAASETGFSVEDAAIPCAEGCGVQEAVSDGEDYELLLAIPRERLQRARPAFEAAFPNLKLTEIGELTADRSQAGLSGKGWDHFAGDER